LLQELSNLHDLLSRLPERECGEVLALWDALMVARHDCEVMAARGVRVSRDISRDWQETVSDLIDRVVAQDNELGQLRQQVRKQHGDLVVLGIVQTHISFSRSWDVRRWCAYGEVRCLLMLAGIGHNMSKL
jgi:hypothetical protein